MTKLSWNPSERPYFAGVDRGVLYLAGQPGIAWTGLVSVSEKANDVVKTDRYLDGFRIVLAQESEEFTCTVSAYSYPEEFETCVGYDDIYDVQQPKPFNMAYRIGTEETGQLHLIYNATARPSDKGWETLSDQPGTALFVWDVSTRPEKLEEVAPTAHIIIELADIYDQAREAVYAMLYGTASTDPRMPDFPELYDIFRDNADFIVVDNGDGTWTATGPDEAIQMLDATTFEITWPSAIYIDNDTYTLTTY